MGVGGYKLGANIYTFLAACWWLWPARNSLCLANEVISPYSLKLIAVNFANLLAQSFPKSNLTTQLRLVKWNAYYGQGSILNVDGSSPENPGVSGLGGLLRNNNGAWIRSFSGNIGFSNILHAELMAMYHGLRLAWELEVTNLVCYSYSKTTINLIFATVNDWHHYAPIIRNIQELLARDWQVRVLHTLREGNACAEYLAKLGAGSHESFWSIEHPPAGINLLLLTDASGTFFSR